jgi:hypothetical protein
VLDGKKSDVPAILKALCSCEGVTISYHNAIATISQNKNAGEEISYDEFCRFVQEHQSVLSPLFHLQAQLRKHLLGEKEWKRMAKTKSCFYYKPTLSSPTDESERPDIASIESINQVARINSTLRDPSKRRASRSNDKGAEHSSDEAELLHTVGRSNSKLHSGGGGGGSHHSGLSASASASKANNIIVPTFDISADSTKLWPSQQPKSHSHHSSSDAESQKVVAVGATIKEHEKYLRDLKPLFDEIKISPTDVASLVEFYAQVDPHRTNHAPIAEIEKILQLKNTGLSSSALFNILDDGQGKNVDFFKFCIIVWDMCTGGHNAIGTYSTSPFQILY